MSSREPVSSVDTAWLRMDRPYNLMQIVGVMLFEGDLDFARLRAGIERRMLSFRRFRQTVIADGSGFIWQDDANFSLDHHLHREVLPDPAGKAELQQFVAELASAPLNPARPLWDFHLVDTSLGGQALVIRIHHCIADGIALVGVILSLADEAGAMHEPAAPSTSEDAATSDESDFWDAIWGPMSDVKSTSLRVASNLWGVYREAVQNPARMLDYARIGSGIAGEIAKLAIMPDDSDTRFKGRLGTTKRVAWSVPIPLPQVKAVGSVLGCSVNDLLLSAAAGAFGGYLAERGDATDGVEIRAMVPVNMRRPQDAGKLGNRFGLVVLELPVGIENPLARLYATRARMEQLKGSYQAALTLSILGVVGMAPKLLQDQVLDLLSAKATAVMTNVPGPKDALYIAGAKMREPLFWVPQAGDIGIGVSILSYDDKVQFGLVADSNLVPDPQRIVERFAREFEKLVLLVLMEPWGRLRDPQAVEDALNPGAPRKSPRRAVKRSS